MKIKINEIVLFIPLLIGVLGFIIALELGETYAIGSMTLVIPLIFSSIIYFHLRSEINIKKVPLFNISLRIGLLNSLLFHLVSLLALYISNERPLIYFIIISCIFCNIFLQIFNQDNYSKHFIISILIQTNLLFLNLIWSKNLHYPFFFEYFDIFVHLRYMEYISTYGRVDSFMSLYQYFPIQHIFIAISSMVSNISIKQSLFIFVGFAYLNVINIYYLFIKYLFKDVELALISTLILAITPHTIFHAAYATPRAFNLIFLMIIIYLFISKNQIKARLLYLFFTMIAIITHSASNPQFIIVLSTFYLISIIPNLKSSDMKFKPTANYLFIFIILMISYWMYAAYALFNKIVVNTFYKAFVVVEQEGVDILAATPQTNLTFFLINNIYASIFLFLLLFCILNIKKITTGPQEWEKYKPLKPFIFASLIFSLLYFPNPLGISNIASGIFMIWRWGLYVELFIIICISVGLLILIKTLINSNRNILKIIKIPLVIIIIMSICFFSITNNFSASDITIYGNSKANYRPYFNDYELNIFNKINAIAGNKTMLVDLPTILYYRLNKFPKLELINVVDNTIIVEKNALLILRKDEFEKDVIPISNQYISILDTTVDYNSTSILFDAGKIVLLGHAH